MTKDQKLEILLDAFNYYQDRTSLTKKDETELSAFYAELKESIEQSADQTKPKCTQHQFVGVYSGYEVSYLQCLNCPETKPF